jgi:hypothetical protein
MACATFSDFTETSLSFPVRSAVLFPLLAIFAALTLAYGYAELRISTLIVVMGLAFLFAPASFEIWPERWRDGRGVLATLLVLQVVAITALYQVGSSLLDPIS